MVEVSDVGIAEAKANVEHESNLYYAGPMGMEAMFGKILVVEDEFRSGYECATCSETGKIDCDNCGGKGSYESGPLSKKCSPCDGTGKVKCVDCNGTGALLVIPDTSKRRPTTGQIVSVGGDVKSLHRGDYVAYSNFCGEVWDLSGIDAEGIERTIVVRHMKENEVICKVTNHLSLRRMKNRANQSSG